MEFQALFENLWQDNGEEMARSSLAYFRSREGLMFLGGRLGSGGCVGWDAGNGGWLAGCDDGGGGRDVVE
jgi:hypothetical protein